MTFSIASFQKFEERGRRRVRKASLAKNRMLKWLSLHRRPEVDVIEWRGRQIREFFSDSRIFLAKSADEFDELRGNKNVFSQ